MLFYLRHFGRLLPLLTLALISALSAPPAWADTPSLQVEADRTELTLGDDFELRIEVSGRFDDYQRPNLSDFITTSQRRSSQFHRGVQSHTEIFQLRPQKLGTYTISGGALFVDGRKIAEAPPLTITVAAPQQAPAIEAEDALAPPRESGEPAWIRWQTPKTTLWVGETFPLIMETWIRADLQVSAPDIIHESEFEGLVVEDLRERPGLLQEGRQVGRQRFDTYVLKTLLATPLKAGRTLIDQSTVAVHLSRGGFMSSHQRFTLKTQPYYLDIRPLPTADRPARFPATHIGQFTFNSSLVDDQGRPADSVRTGQRLILRAEISGQGNLHALQPPFIEADPKDFDIQLLSSDQDGGITRDRQGIRGQRHFQWLVSPLRAGTLTAPRVVFHHFDPVTATYHTSQSPELTLASQGGEIRRDTQQHGDLGEDVGPLLTGPFTERPPDTPWALHPAYGLFLALFPLLWLSLRLRRNIDTRKRDTAGQRAERQAHTRALRSLRALQKQPPGTPIYAELRTLLHTYLSDKWGLNARGLSYAQLRQNLPLSPAATDALISHLERLDTLHYSGQQPTPEAHTRALSETEALLSTLESDPQRGPQ